MFSFPEGSIPSAFKPTLNDSFLQSLYQNINSQEDQDVGEAQSEAVRRGLTGTPFEAASVGAARNTANIGRQGALSNFLYNLAGQGEQENILQEQQGYQTGERQASEQFQAGQNALDRQLSRDTMAQRERMQNQSDLYGLYGGIAEAGGTAIGSILGGPIGGAVAGRLTKRLVPQTAQQDSSAYDQFA